MGISILSLLSFLIPVGKKILKVSEAAERLGLSPSKIYELVKPDQDGNAELASTRVGGTIKLFKTEVDRYIREKTTTGKKYISEFTFSITKYGIEIRIFKRMK